MMKTTFSIFLLLFTLTLSAENIIVKNFEIENRNQQVSFVNAKASALANRVIRDNAYLFFIDPKKDSDLYSSCWKKFIINRKISIDVTENVHRLVKKTRGSYFYEVYLKPSKIKIRGVSSSTFNNFCKSNGLLLESSVL